MKKLLYIFPLFFTTLFFGQENCNCEVALKSLVSKVEKEYPGFRDKTKNQNSYIIFKDNLIEKSKSATSDLCPSILKSYTDFYKDPHLWVGSNGKPFATLSGRTNFTSIEIDLSEFKKNIQFSKDKYEGIWSTDSYTFGIKKTKDNEYTGFIIEANHAEWKPKNIKFKLYLNGKYEYALLDKSIKEGSYRILNESILYLEDVSVAMVKNSPKPLLNPDQIKEKIKELTGFYFKQISPRTSIIKLPSFDYKYLKTIDSLIEKNKTLLESENLIIDLRGNTGGTTDAYQKLLPYISGKYIRNTGAEFLSTKTYIDNLEAYKKTLEKTVSTVGIDNQIKKLKENLGEFVNFNKSDNKEISVEEIKLAKLSPKNIIVFANGMTGSAAEYFLFIAKQSKKVKIFGKPSYGGLDYGNAFLVDLECKEYQVLMPTYRALRLPDYPIDNIGIQPDIYIDNSIEDWVKFTIDYLEN